MTSIYVTMRDAHSSIAFCDKQFHGLDELTGSRGNICRKTGDYAGVMTCVDSKSIDAFDS